MGEFVRAGIPARWRAELSRRARENRKAPTLSEHLLWQELRRRKRGGVKFRRQHPIGPYIADFYSAQYRLAIEVDGSSHEAQHAEDAVRDAHLAQLGIRVVRVSAFKVETAMDEVMAKIERALDELAPLIAPSPRQRDPEP